MGRPRPHHRNPIRIPGHHDRRGHQAGVEGAAGNPGEQHPRRRSERIGENPIRILHHGSIFQFVPEADTQPLPLRVAAPTPAGYFTLILGDAVDLDVIDPSHCRCTLSKPAVVDCGLFRRAVHASSCLLSCLWPTSLLLPLLFPALLISILRGLARSASGIVNLSTPAS